MKPGGTTSLSLDFLNSSSVRTLFTSTQRSTNTDLGPYNDIYKKDFKKRGFVMLYIILTAKLFTWFKKMIEKKKESIFAKKQFNSKLYFNK